MAKKRRKKSAPPPLDFTLFLEAHRRSEIAKRTKEEYAENAPPRNRFGQISPKSYIEKIKKQGLHKSRNRLENGGLRQDRLPDDHGSRTHGVKSKYILNRYSDRHTVEGKALYAIMKAIESDIGKPFDARQSLIMSLIRSKIVIVMQIGKYLESQAEIVDYEKGTVPHVVDKTFFAASNSLRQALNELYSGKNGHHKAKKTYEEIVEKMKEQSK